MSPTRLQRARLGVGAVLIAVVAGGGGYWLAVAAQRRTFRRCCAGSRARYSTGTIR